MACPAKRGVARREGPVGAAFVIGAPRGGGVREEIPAGACLGVNDQSNNLTCLSSRSSCSRMHFRTISSSRPSVLTQSSSPTGLSPEEERNAFNSTPDRQSLPGSHGQRPWVYLVLTCDVELNCVDAMTVASCEVKSGEDDRIFVRLRIDGPFSIHYLSRLEDEQKLGPWGHRRGCSKFP